MASLVTARKQGMDLPFLGLYISLPLYVSELWESPPFFHVFFLGGELLISKVLSLSFNSLQEIL